VAISHRLILAISFVEMKYEMAEDPFFFILNKWSPKLPETDVV